MASYVQRACDSIAGFRQRYEKFSKLLTVRQYAKGTVLDYTSKVACVCLVYGKLPEDLSEDDISDYLHGLLRRVPCPARSAFAHVKIGLSSYYGLMGFSSRKILLPRIKTRVKLPAVLSGKEMWALLRGTSDLREKLMLTLLYGLGLRKGELLRLEVRDIDTGRMRVHIRQSKGCKDRHVPLPVSAVPLINRYMRDYGPVRYVIYGSRVGEPVGGREVTGVLKRALIRIACPKKVTCHTLRHTFAAHAVESGTSIVRIKEWLGHGDLKTTMIYLHVADLTGNPPPAPLDCLCAVFGKKK